MEHEEMRELVRLHAGLSTPILVGIEALGDINSDKYQEIIDEGDNYLEQSLNGKWYTNAPYDAQRFVNMTLVPALAEALEGEEQSGNDIIRLTANKLTIEELMIYVGRLAANTPNGPLRTIMHDAWMSLDKYRNNLLRAQSE